MAGVPARLAAALQAWPWLPTFVTLVRRFRDERLALTAAGLTFTTLISLVPLVTVMLALFSAFPMFSTLQDSLQRYLLQTLIPDTIARPVMAFITQFSNRASRLGIVGLVALVFSAVALMLTIDRTLNAIWRVRVHRPIAQRILVYWAAVTLGPLLFAVSLAATSFAVTASRGMLGDMPRGFGIVVSVVEFVVESVGVAALFHYVPHTFVRWRHALLGGIFVAIGLVALKRGVTYYFAAVPTYAMIYGAFATVPIFLVWIYVSWIIVLLGAVIAAYAPLVGKQMGDWKDAPGRQFHLALNMLREFAMARGAERRGLRSDELAEATHTNPLQTEPVLDRLVALGWVGKLEERGNPRYVLLCDPATTLAEPLVASLLLDPAPDLEAIWTRAGFSEMTLGDILAGETVVVPPQSRPAQRGAPQRQASLPS